MKKSADKGNSSNNGIKPHRPKGTVLGDSQINASFALNQPSTVPLGRCGFDGLCSYCCRWIKAREQELLGK